MNVFARAKRRCCFGTGNRTWDEGATPGLPALPAASATAFLLIMLAWLAE